jgi:hypothetical protein
VVLQEGGVVNQELAEVMQTAFDYVSRVYRESSYLFKDLQDAMDRAGFQPVSIHPDSETSSQIDYPQSWMPRFLSMYWRLKRGGAKNVYVGVTIAFFTPENRSIKPTLFYGIVRSMDDDRAVKPRLYLWYAGTGHGANFTYGKPGKSPLDAPGSLVRFVCTLADVSYNWPKVGYLKAVPLTEVQGVDQVHSVAQELKDLWTQHAARL